MAGGLLPGALAGDASGRLGRLRVVLGQAPARAGQAPEYEMWRALYDDWGEAERSALRIELAAAPEVDAVVVGPEGSGRVASLDSLARQWRRAASVACAAAGEARPAGAAPWTLVLRAGDVLAPHALACFALQAGRSGDAVLIYADTDLLGPAGRTAPLFKPGADARLARAGLLTRGACLVRGEVAEAGGVAPERLALLAAGAPDRVGRVPFVLTHLANTEAIGAPPAAEPEPVGAQPFVSIVIPTGLRSRHVLRCLRRVVGTTDYAGGFEILLAVSRNDPGDGRQAAMRARAARLPGVRVLDLGMARFNYAQANNLAVAQARGTLVLLLNDDVAPIRPDWLARLVAIGNGIVGARLLYGNGLVQHGGVIMGLGHLCEHAFRLARCCESGPHGLALLDREVSAVTGACLLVGRELYMSLGGMDESFVIALNDVDFCARARQAGVRVVFAASVCLHHYEGLSLGRHYAGERAAFESLEVKRLRARWASVIADDPFYHPRASLEPGREFQPGFPPRLTPLSWIAGDPAAQG